MKSFTHNCNEVERASNKKTINIYIRYKTPILEGAIKIINEFLKHNNDGVHYKNLCEELHKYAKVQKKCFRQEVTKQGKPFTTKEWKIILDALLVTFKFQKINRLCYLENDNEISKKKEILNIHDAFRNFCIEKKRLYENTSNMDFLQCNEYMTWLNRKKKELQALDPNYSNMKEYEEYFNIRSNCNYPWLLKDSAGITCQKTTRSREGEKKGKETTLDDTHSNIPVVTQVNPSDGKKGTPLATQPPSKGDVHQDSAKTSDTGQEQIPNKTASSSEPNNAKDKIVLRDPGITIGGTPVPEPMPVFPPIPDYKDPKYKDIIDSLRNNLDGQKIPRHVRNPINQNHVNFSKDNINYIDGHPIEPTITKSHNIIPPENLRTQPFRELLRTQKFITNLFSKKRYIPHIIYSQKLPPVIPRKIYSPAPKSMKIHAASFPSEFPFFPRITTGRNTDTKIKEVVKIEPAKPGPSHFRSPSMIYVLGFLILFTIVSMLFLLFQYTPLGLLFSKKKKMKKRLKRHFKFKKIEKEPQHFDEIDKDSVNDIRGANKKCEENIYKHIKIQKVIINEDTNLLKRKKKKGKTHIDIHMELLNEYKNDEWELNKNDFLNMCLEELIRKLNTIQNNSANNEVTIKNKPIKSTKEEKIVLWNKWAEKYRSIWENLKRENTFKVLQYKWKQEEKAYLENIGHSGNDVMNEKQPIPLIEIKKDIWRKWIAKEATLIEQYKEEQWIKSLLEEIEKISDEYKQVEAKDDIFVVNIGELEHKENNEELYKHYKHIFLIKVMIQMLMMVIEECIKEENPEKTELVLDNLIGKMNKEKRKNIKSEYVENISEENKNHLEWNKIIEQDTPADQDSLKQLIEGWTRK
ncbi:STP1 protein [Plasmodium ovale curtisi]|uniref:STP1 protein n=1 Tax=Plasmodium ovale curtisi TaxID=864141 RepID=A0A1A8X395_PLAOA|nr:STP1 protein [Plasmodium ovale curtisi]